MMATLKQMFSRRAVLAAAALAVSCCFVSSAGAADGKKKVLFFTKSSGFQHSVITRKDPNQLAHAEKILTEIAAKEGYEVTCTKDGSYFTDEKLKDFDVLAFYTTGDLTQAGTDKTTPMPKDGFAAVQRFIDSGKGYIGFHCASDTFHSPNYRNNEFDCSGEVTPYIKMVGGEFFSHQSQQNSWVRFVSKDFPGLSGFKDFQMKEEWYSLKNFNPDIHVILVQDTTTMKTDRGVVESNYKRAPFPETWARMEGKGRVFYTSMGHREDVWTNPVFQQVTLAGLNWAAGKTNFQPKPNMKQATPGAKACQDATAAAK